MEIIGYVPFEDNRKFREYLAEKFSGYGLIYVQVAEDRNDPKSVMNAQPVPLSAESCRVIGNNSGHISLVFDKKTMRLMLDWRKIKVVKDNKGKLTDCINKIKHVLGDVPVMKELEDKITSLTKSVEDLYNKE